MLCQVLRPDNRTVRLQALEALVVSWGEQIRTIHTYRER